MTRDKILNKNFNDHKQVPYPLLYLPSYILHPKYHFFFFKSNFPFLIEIANTVFHLQHKQIDNLHIIDVIQMHSNLLYISTRHSSIVYYKIALSSFSLE